MAEGYLFFRPKWPPELALSHARPGITQCSGGVLKDLCAGRSHMTWSFSCALAEAVYLKRTLVLPDVLCCHAVHCGTERCEQTTKFFALSGQDVVLESQLPGLQPTMVNCTRTTADLNQVDSLVAAPAIRYYRPCTEYYYDRCGNNHPISGGVQLERDNRAYMPFGLSDRLAPAMARIMWRLRTLSRISNATASCVHVRRGDKLMDRWPCTEFDTTPSAIERTLLDAGVARGSVLYVASNENQPGFFEPLNRTFLTFTQNSFDSGTPVDLRDAVGIDYTVCSKVGQWDRSRARMPIETFGRESFADDRAGIGLSLTTDTKHGCERSGCTERAPYACRTPGHSSVRGVVIA